ncbi:MAG: helix-turn-helix transcriptional regulator [Anaerolineae bacterium]|nr:helix-turn-helix transcriptional regulator [Anaerolineae bacterium]
MIRNFFLGFIKIHILYHAVRKPVYGLDLIRELARHGYSLSPGTLYPVLHSLAREDYLSVEKQVVNGKVRKYYAATKRGKEALSEAYARARELMDEISNDNEKPITEST